MRTCLSFIFVFIFKLTVAWGHSTCLKTLNGRSNVNYPPFGKKFQKSPIPKMANLLLKSVSADSPETIQIAFPTFLKFNPNQAEQFGDGQKNAIATYGDFTETPYKVTLRRSNQRNVESDIVIELFKIIPGIDNIKEMEVSINNESQILSIGSDKKVGIKVDTGKLGWDSLYEAQAIFFRPKGWHDWFAVQFPNAYVSIENFMNSIPANSRNYSDGTSLVDPLGLANSQNIQSKLKEMSVSESKGFKLARAERVHGIYLDGSGSNILTSSGGVWTRYRLDGPSKNVYLVKDPRNLQAEKNEDVVSGTGPHYIGATGEIILNSLENSSLMTFYGISSPLIGPNNEKIAWSFSHQWIGTWLKPGYAFIAPQGTYHWHLNHTERPLGAQVITPPNIPSPENHFGF